MLPKVKSKSILPLLFVLVFALSRIPGAVSYDFANFSAAYALMFCAGVYFPGRMAWWLPLGTMLLTDIGLNFIYWWNGWPVWDVKVIGYQLFNYGAYAVVILLGRQFKPGSSFFALLGGGLLGALLFYFITNTMSWLFNPFRNPEYVKTFLGWLTALIKGTGGWPETWQLFRNTLLSGGLFTALFVAAMKFTTPESPQEKEAGRRPEETEAEETPEGAEAARGS